MPRLLFDNSIISENVMSTLGATAGFVLVCAALLLVCASHSQPLQRILSSMSFRRSEPVISVYQVQPGVEGEPCIWQRGILMGEKCQLPDYSGVITYDTAGNLIAPGATLGWFPQESHQATSNLNQKQDNAIPSVGGYISISSPFLWFINREEGEVERPWEIGAGVGGSFGASAKF